MSDLTIEYFLYDQISSDIVKEIVSMEREIFPSPMKEEKIARELSSKFNITILIAYEEGNPIGYKVGFERSKRIYYSWIGGVIPIHRGKGIASELMRRQHQIITEMGYRVVCTQTSNSFKPMVILNLNSGFDIKGVIQSTGDDYLTIVMEKALS
ncbi:GNAT family N-acetyltransferase [Halobacteriovorax marinus]|nr:GNAT family N-acetyltransferase [Halobacteriovorax marinus]